jgi:hypothetical protein
MGLSIQLPATVAIGFTGHRALDDEAKCRKWIRDFLEQKKSSTSALVYGISSVAAGGDLLFAESCLELALPLCVLLPMPVEEFRPDFNEADWARAEKILSQAASVDVTSGNQSREECYYECGIETVQQSRLLLALWNGESAQGMGGTEDVVSFAKGIGKPVVWLHSTSGEISTFNEKTERELLDDPELDFLNRLPDAKASKKTKIDLSDSKFDSVSHPCCHSERSAAKSKNLRFAFLAQGWETSSPNEGRINQPETLPRAWFCKVDESATRCAPQFRRLAAIPIVFTAAAALFTGAGSWSHQVGTWLSIGTALGILAAVLPVVLRLQKQQVLWVRTRTAAEVCRSVLAFWSTPFPYEAIGPEAVPELSGMLMSLKLLKVLDRGRSEPSLDEFKRQYRQERVAHQLDYLSRHAAQSAAEAGRYRVASWVAIGLAAALNVWIFASTRFIEGFASGPWKQGMALGAAIAFQIATVAGALLAVNDCDRRRLRYRELHDQLEDWDAQLESLRTWPSVLRVAGRIERALLTELIEWRSLIRNHKQARK